MVSPTRIAKQIRDKEIKIKYNSAEDDKNNPLSSKRLTLFLALFSEYIRYR